MADDFLTQVHFTGESGCVKFVPNPFKGNMCVTCSKEIFKHYKSSVESKEVLMKVGKFVYGQTFPCRHLSNMDTSLMQAPL
jgi:hypothetical protein